MFSKKNFCRSKLWDGHTWPCWENIFAQLDCTENMFQNLLWHSLSIWKQKNKSGWKYFNLDFPLQKIIIIFFFLLIWNLQDNSIGSYVKTVLNNLLKKLLKSLILTAHEWWWWGVFFWKKVCDFYMTAFFFAVLLWVWGAQRYHCLNILISILSLI